MTSLDELRAAIEADTRSPEWTKQLGRSTLLLLALIEEGSLCCAACPEACDPRAPRAASDATYATSGSSTPSSSSVPGTHAARTGRGTGSTP
jgi:hypothetical protein